MNHHTCLKWLALAASVLSFSSIAEAQAIRFDSFSYTTSSACAPGKQCQVLALPGTQVNVCQGTAASLSACLSSPGVTYTSAGAGTTCSTTSQLTPATGGACLATSDNQGNFGFWVLSGSYSYYLRVPQTAGGGTYGPYPFSVHGDSGGYTFDANYATLQLACAAAGSGTLAITKRWDGTPSQTLSCNLWFLGGGIIQPASGQLVNISGSVDGAAIQHFDYSAGGTVTLTGATGIIYPEWWGVAVSSLGYGCTAAGSRTITIDRVWSSLITASYACGMEFLGTGNLAVAASNTVTLSGTITAPVGLTIFAADGSASGSVLITGKVPVISASWWGTSNSANLFQASTAAAGNSNGSTLLISTPFTSLTTAVITAVLNFATGGSLSPAAGQAVTIGPKFTCGTYSQCFDLSASGSTVVFSSPPAYLNPNWYGADATGGSASTTAITVANAAAQTAKTDLYFPTGTYKHAGLTITGNVTWYGDLRQRSILLYSGTGTAITGATQISGAINNLVILSSAGTASIGMDITGATEFKSDGLLIGGSPTSGFTTGLRMRTSGGDFNHFTSSWNATGVLLDTAGSANTQVVFENCEVFLATNAAFQMTDVGAANISGCHFEAIQNAVLIDNTSSGVVATGVITVQSNTALLLASSSGHTFTNPQFINVNANNAGNSLAIKNFNINFNNVGGSPGNYCNTILKTLAPGGATYTFYARGNAWSGCTTAAFYGDTNAIYLAPYFDALPGGVTECAGVMLCFPTTEVDGSGIHGSVQSFTDLTVDSTTATTLSKVNATAGGIAVNVYQDAAANKWSAGKDGDNSYYIYNDVLNIAALRAQIGGDLVLEEDAAHNVGVGKSPSTGIRLDVNGIVKTNAYFVNATILHSCVGAPTGMLAWSNDADMAGNHLVVTCP